MSFIAQDVLFKCEEKMPLIVSKHRYARENDTLNTISALDQHYSPIYVTYEVINDKQHVYFSETESV